MAQAQVSDEAGMSAPMGKTSGSSAPRPQQSIEENASVDLSRMLREYEPPEKLLGDPVDVVAGRYRVEMGNPLPQFDTSGAKAYAVHDENGGARELYAAVCNPDVPYRIAAIEKLKGLEHPNLVCLAAHDTITLSQLSQRRQVLIFDRPKGQRLSEVIASNPGYHEKVVASQILEPIGQVLKALKEAGVCHGRIHPEHIFFGDRIMVGECLSAPCGLDQEFLYEPIERLLASSNHAKGDGSNKTDSYAIAILAYDILHGIDPFRQLGERQYADLLLDQGSYNALGARVEFSALYQDFFRGLLNESMEERWSADQVVNWLAGKRYNLIHPSMPRESSRPFTFAGRDYFSQRALANALYRNWEDAENDLRRQKLDRWLENSVHKSEVAEQIQRVIRASGGENTTDKRLNRELVSRSIAVLDPQGPLRQQSVSICADGLGNMLAHCLNTKMQDELNHIVGMIDNDLPSFWAEMPNSFKSTEASNILWKLPKVRTALRTPAMGFGLERAMYDLCPNLPCQSSLVLGHHVTDLSTLLTTLDVLAHQIGTEQALMDVHIAAFAASRVDLSKEIKFPELAHLPDLRASKELVVLRILGMAQDKQVKKRLVGLSTWVALRLSEIINRIHNRTLRRQLRSDLKRAANTGYIARVLEVILNKQVTSGDQFGFERAAALFQRNAQKIHQLEDESTLEKVSTELGLKFAVLAAYCILMITMYVLLDNYLG